MKIKYRRWAAALLTAAVAAGGPGAVLPVQAAEASVVTDETMYVNLDYYGRPSKVNVVKGCSLNGKNTFTDYGDYQLVENMSGAEEPQLGEQSVTWQVAPEHTGRFYYKCTMDETKVELPWDFDVSYKLNGVPTDANELAGASGLVEIHVKATPNERAGLYYRNNMMLMVAVPVDLASCYSVEADGSQTQNLGETTAVVFTALPGEEGDYKVRIGTDSFETTGVLMTMMPGTMEDLKHIKDLKEAKDTWQDAGDQLYDSLEQMAESIEAMREGVNQAKSGASSAQRAREKWSDAKDSILAGNEEALSSLTALSGQLETMVPHLQTAKDVAEVIHRNFEDIVVTMEEMQDPLRRLHTQLNGIEANAEDIAKNLPDIQKEMETILALDATLQANEQMILSSLGSLSGTLAELDEEDSALVSAKSARRSAGSSGAASTGSGAGSSAAGSSAAGTSGSGAAGSGTGSSATGSGTTDAGEGSGAGSVSGGAGNSATNTNGGTQNENGGSAAQGGTDDTADGKTEQSGNGTQESGSGNSGAADTVGSDAGQSGSGTDTAQESDGASQNDSSQGGDGASQSDSVQGDSGQASGQGGEALSLSIMRKDAPRLTASANLPLDASTLLQLLQSKETALMQVSSTSRKLTNSLSYLLEDASDASHYSREIIDNLDYLIEDVRALKDSLDVYYPDIQASIDDSAELVNRTTEALNSGINTMTIVQNTLRATSDDADAAARDGLGASLKLLDESLNVLDSTTAIRQAGRVMKDTVDGQLDKFDTENRFLFMDPTEAKVSFTSEKNAEPNTLQIVLRTDEISPDSEENKVMDAEVEKAHVSPLKRMWNVLVQMWRAIVSIFKNR